MVVAVLDDLMFSSKIRAASAGLGVSVTFARSRQAALTAIETHGASLVILDLNNARVDPLGVVAALKASGSAVPTVGFVSHVQADLIDAARAAGVTDVLARSAFVQQLPDILARGR